VWVFFLLDWFIRITSLVIKVWCLTETRVFGYKIPFPIQLYSIVSFYIAWWVDIPNQRTTITMTNRIVVLLIKVMRCHEKLIIWFDYMKQNWRQLYSKIVSILLTYFLRTYFSKLLLCSANRLCNIQWCLRGGPRNGFVTLAAVFFYSFIKENVQLKFYSTGTGNIQRRKWPKSLW